MSDLRIGKEFYKHAYCLSHEIVSSIRVDVCINSSIIDADMWHKFTTFQSTLWSSYKEFLVKHKWYQLYQNILNPERKI